MRHLKILLLGLMIAGLVFGPGCGGSGSSGSGTGTLSLYLTDAAADHFKAIYITIGEVWVHKADSGDADENTQGEEAGQNGRTEDGWREGEDGWIHVASPGKTYNLLELVNGVMAELGTTELEAGHYTQVRLMLGQDPEEGSHPFANYVVGPDGTAVELTVPSGYQTGIKLVHGFEVTAGSTAELVLDFDAARSVVVTGSGKYLLKPTIQVAETFNYAVVKGVVTDASGAPIPGAAVSAQKIGPESDPRVFTATRTGDENGQAGAYQMYLPAGTYDIVAYKGDVFDDQGDPAAYGPSCRIVEASQPDAVYGENNFTLALSKTGDIEVEVRLPETAEQALQTVTLSVRISALCPGNGDPVEIASKTVAESGTYRFSVPAAPQGTAYTVVASGGGVAKKRAVTVNPGLSGPVIEFDFT